MIWHFLQDGSWTLFFLTFGFIFYPFSLNIGFICPFLGSSYGAFMSEDILDARLFFRTQPQRLSVDVRTPSNGDTHEINFVDETKINFLGINAKNWRSKN